MRFDNTLDNSPSLFDVIKENEFPIGLKKATNKNINKLMSLFSTGHLNAIRNLTNSSSFTMKFINENDFVESLEDVVLLLGFDLFSSTSSFCLLNRFLELEFDN